MAVQRNQIDGGLCYAEFLNKDKLKNQMWRWEGWWPCKESGALCRKMGGDEGVIGG